MAGQAVGGEGVDVGMSEGRNYSDLHKEWKQLIKFSKEIKAKKEEIKRLMAQATKPQKAKLEKSQRVKSLKIPKDLERADAMVALYKQGKTLQEIADSYGMTRERVRQVLKGMGITRNDGGRSLRPKKPKNPDKPKRVPRVCSVEGCERKHQSNGYCNTHLFRWRRLGHPGSAEIIPVGKHKNRGNRYRKGREAD